MRAAVSYIENHSAKINTNTNAVWCQTGPGRYFPSFEFASVGCRLLSRLALGNHFDAVRSYRTKIFKVVVLRVRGEQKLLLLFVDRIVDRDRSSLIVIFWGWGLITSHAH